MKLSILAGSTSQSVNVFIRDSTSTTGGGLAAVAPAGGALLTGTKLYYSFTGANATAGVAVSLSVLATVGSAYSSAGIVTLDATNMIGWVRIDIPNAALATSKGRIVSFHLYGGTNMAPTPFEIELTGWDNQDSVHGGLTALPNAAANAAGGLPVSIAGGLDMDDIGADVDTIETRVVLSLPAAAPNAAGGLLITTAGSLDMDDIGADVDAIETRVILSLPAAAPQAAGGLVTSAAGSLDFDDLAADVDAIETTIGAAGVGLTAVKLSSTGLDSILMSDITAVPAITGTLKQAINWFYILCRNRRWTTATTETIYKDDGTTPVATAVKSDDATTYKRDKYS